MCLCLVNSALVSTCHPLADVPSPSCAAPTRLCSIWSLPESLQSCSSVGVPMKPSLASMLAGLLQKRLWTLEAAERVGFISLPSSREGLQDHIWNQTGFHVLPVCGSGIRLVLWGSCFFREASPSSIQEQASCSETPWKTQGVACFG